MDKYNVETRASDFMTKVDNSDVPTVINANNAMRHFIRPLWAVIQGNVRDEETTVEEAIHELSSRLIETFKLHFDGQGLSFKVLKKKLALGYRIEVITTANKTGFQDSSYFTILTAPVSYRPVLLDYHYPAIRWRLVPYYQLNKVVEVQLMRVEDKVYIPIKDMPGMTKELQELYDEVYKGYLNKTLKTLTVKTDENLKTSEILRKMLEG